MHRIQYIQQETQQSGMNFSCVQECGHTSLAAFLNSNGSSLPLPSPTPLQPTTPVKGSTVLSTLNADSPLTEALHIPTSSFLFSSHPTHQLLILTSLPLSLGKNGNSKENTHMLPLPTHPHSTLPSLTKEEQRGPALHVNTQSSASTCSRLGEWDGPSEIMASPASPNYSSSTVALFQVHWWFD